MIVSMPLVPCLALATLAKGRPALTGIGAALLFVGLAAFLMRGGGDGFAQMFVLMALGGVVLAGIVQALRIAMGEGRPRWAYPAIVGVAPLVAAVPALMLLGL